MSIAAETEKNIHLAQQFADYVRGIRQKLPPPRVSATDVLEGGDGKQLEKSIKTVWDQIGSDYLSIETDQFFLTTMMAVLENIGAPQGRERWLSLGSGLGVYETYLARLFSDITVQTIDTSQAMVDFQNGLVAAHPELQGRVVSHTGSMSQLQMFRSGFFKNVLCINSLQWCRQWKQTVREIDRVLSSQPQSLIFFTLASARGQLKNGETVLVNPDLSASALVQGIESYKLKVIGLGALRVTKGQLGRPTERVYIVAQRDLSSHKRDWARRLKRGEGAHVDYAIVGDSPFNLSLEVHRF